MSVGAAIKIESLKLAKLRGFCAGVVRAIDVVEKALEVLPTPLYVRKEIVHNKYVVEDLKRRGVVFVDELADVPDGNWVIFSAHGVSPAVVAEAKARGLKAIDATCPLVSKVHMEAVRYDKQGYSIILIGHGNHDEAVGTLGYAPANMVLVEDVLDAHTVEVANPDKVAVVTQTTLSMDDTLDVMKALEKRFPGIVTPGKDDICYATQNRQNAVKVLAPQVDLVLVVGSRNSSNSQRLVDVAKACGAQAYLVDGPEEIQEEWLKGVKRLGLSAGASAPEILVQKVVTYLKERYSIDDVSEVETVEEDVLFALPKELEQLR